MTRLCRFPILIPALYLAFGSDHAPEPECIVPLLFRTIISQIWTLTCILFSLAEHCKNVETLPPSGSEGPTTECGRRQPEAGSAVAVLPSQASPACPAPLLPREPAKVLRILLVSTQSSRNCPFVLSTGVCPHSFYLQWNENFPLSQQESLCQSSERGRLEADRHTGEEVLVPGGASQQPGCCPGTYRNSLPESSPLTSNGAGTVTAWLTVYFGQHIHR